jgi:hypothetical protein
MKKEYDFSKAVKNQYLKKENSLSKLKKYSSFESGNKK